MPVEEVDRTHRGAPDGTFDTGEARLVHTKGEISQTLGSAVPDLTASDPDFALVDIIAVELALTSTSTLRLALPRYQRPRLGTTPTRMDILRCLVPYAQP
jgi:hypothetical protein